MAQQLGLEQRRGTAEKIGLAFGLFAIGAIVLGAIVVAVILLL